MTCDLPVALRSMESGGDAEAWVAKVLHLPKTSP